MPPRKKKPAAASIGLDATDVSGARAPADISALAAAIASDGGAALASYRDPFGAHWVILAALPIDKVEPTPYQRELSKTHADRLAGVIQKVGMFLDPLVVVRHDSGYWTPNGMHRLMALRSLGAKAVTALVVPNAEIAYRILALNTEKAHNLKDKSLEVARMARGLAELDGARRESDFAFEFEEPALLTLGLCYEEAPRFSGGVYQPILRRTEAFADAPLVKSLRAREGQRDKLLELDAAVVAVVAALREAGLQSAYLKPFVVARINPLRFARAEKPGQKAPRALFEQTIDKMIASAKKFDASKVRPQDLAKMAGAPPASDE